MTKLWDVWYEYDGTNHRLPVHVHVVADTIKQAIEKVEFEAALKENHRHPEVYSIKQESERVYV